MKKKTHSCRIIATILLCIFLLSETIGINTNADDARMSNYTGTIKISLAGDCSIGKLSIHSYSGSFDQAFDKYGPDYFFKNVKPIFDSDDMTLVNFEGVLTNSNDIVEKQYNIKGRPEFISVIPASGIDAVSFGNNHRIDYGDIGVVDTINAFNSIALPYAYDTNVAIYTTSQGIRVGFVSVNEVYDSIMVENYLQIGIAKLKEAKADLIFTCCHWGEESMHYIEPYQYELGHKCIDWGADIVVGCHPHVLQGIENYNGKYIIYSLGNFCFGGNKNPKNQDSMIAEVEFGFANGKKIDNGKLQIIPCTISSVTSRNDYCPTPAKGAKYKSIISKLNEYSKDFNVKILPDGWVTPK